MENWSRVVGEPLVKTGKTRIFGQGANPVNFVSVHDVARFIERSVIDPAMRGVVIDVGGPENLSLRQFVQTFQTVTGKAGAAGSIPLPMMRVMAALMRPINPALARQIQAGVVMDTQDMTFDARDLTRRYPSIPLTSLAEVVRRDWPS